MGLQEKDQSRWDYREVQARLVAKGYSQKYGVDYQETFSSMVKLSSIRLLFAYATATNLEIHQIAIKTSFLHEDLLEEIFMKQP